MNNTHSNSNKVISRKTKPRSRSSFKQKGGAFGDDFAGLDIKGNNYCWLAASIQLLWSIKPLREFLLQTDLNTIISKQKYITDTEEEEKFSGEIAKYTFDNLTTVFIPRGFSRIFFKDNKPKIFKDYKNTILALSKVFNSYNNNNKDKDKSTHTQIDDETVLSVLEDAGKESDTNKQGTAIQRTCGDFILYIFKLFQISTNNNTLLKTFSYYRLEITDNGEESVFSNEFILLLNPDGKRQNMTMQQLIEYNCSTNPIQVAAESKNILIMLNHEGNGYKRDSDTKKREFFMNKSISVHQNININNIHYKLRGCVVYSGNDSAGHYIYMVFPDIITDPAVILNGPVKTKQQPREYEDRIQVLGNIYLYEKEELLVDATDDELAASTLTLVATTILGEEQLTNMAQRFNDEKLEALKKQLQLKKEAAALLEQEAEEEKKRTAAARLKQDAEEEEKKRSASGLFKRRVPTKKKEEAEDNNEDEPTDPYRYAESPDYGSSAENIVLGTLLCITIIISTVMLSK